MRIERMVIAGLIFLGTATGVRGSRTGTVRLSAKPSLRTRQIKIAISNDLSLKVDR